MPVGSYEALVMNLPAKQKDEIRRIAAANHRNLTQQVRLWIDIGLAEAQQQQQRKAAWLESELGITVPEWGMQDEP